MELSERKDKIDLSSLLREDFATYKGGKIWTSAFNYAIRNYREIYIPQGKYYID